MPPKAIRDLRDYTRARTRLVQERTRCWQRLEKLLESAIVKLSSVASKLTTVSAQDMIRAMIAGQRDPRVLAALARTGMKAKHDELAEALDGMFDDHHGEPAQLLLDQIAALDGKITQLTAQAADLAAAIPAAWGINADGTTGPEAGTGPDAAALPAVARLAEIPGVSRIRPAPSSPKWAWTWRGSRPPASLARTVAARVPRGPYSGALAFLAADDAIGQFHGAQVPPEDPVQERRIVVAELLPVLMADGELVGDVEQGALVGADQFSLDQLAAFFEDARQGDEGRALVLVGRAPSPEQGNGMVHPGSRVRLRAAEDFSEQRGPAVIEDRDQPAQVLAAVGEPVADAGRLQEFVGFPPVHLPPCGRREVAVVPSAHGVVVIVPLPGARHEVVVDLDEPVERAVIPLVRGQRPQASDAEPLLQLRCRVRFGRVPVVDARPGERLVKIARALKLRDETCEAAADPGGIQVRARHFPAQALWPVRARRGKPPDDVRAFRQLRQHVTRRASATAPLDQESKGTGAAASSAALSSRNASRRRRSIACALTRCRARMRRASAANSSGGHTSS